MKTFYNNNYTASKYAFDTTRKSKAIVERLATRPIDGIEVTDPDADFTDSEGTVWVSSFNNVAQESIARLHGDKYYKSVKTGRPRDLAESQGFDWDEGIFTMAVSHASGLVAAASEAIRNNTTAGSLSSGLHHAHIDFGSGFCTFNGLAAAADFAINGHGLDRVLILDFDAHSGGGTWEIVDNKLPHGSVVQVDVTVAPYDLWTPCGESKLVLSSPQDYREDITNALNNVKDKFDFVIYNAGMDPLNSGVSMADITYRENAVREFIGDTPAIFALAGGYTWGNKTMDDVVDWHSITLNTWASYAQ